MSTLTQLEKLFRTGSISRRQFITRISAMGLGAALSPVLLGRSAFAAAPKKGGRLRLGIGGASMTDTLDPAVVTDIMAPLVSFGLLRNCLVEIDSNNKLVPELAESWEPSPDAKMWHFNLRQGVEFHNGKTLTAEDVVYSLNHHRKADSKSVLKALIKQVVDVKADGPNRVTFTLEAGNADFPYAMSDRHASIFPAGETDFNKGIGTGGYMLKAWEPGVRAFVTRNPNYWKKGFAHFDEVEVLAINDVNARTNAIRTGQVDAINRCERKTFHLLEKTPGIRSLVQKGMRHYNFVMRTDIAPFNDNNLRMAMKHAIDREAILKTILRGYGELGNDHPISRANKYFAGELPQRSYDPDKAKFYLQKAGLSSFKIDHNVADVAFEGAIGSSILFKEQAAKAGIEVNVVREPNDGYWSNVWMKKPFTAAYWSGRPTEDWMFTDAYSEGAAWNETYWSNKRFNDLLKAGRVELDEPKRHQIYAEMQQLVRDDCGEIIPVFAADLHAVSKKIATPKTVAVNWELDGFKCGERWWFA